MEVLYKRSMASRAGYNLFFSIRAAAARYFWPRWWRLGFLATTVDTDCFLITEGAEASGPEGALARRGSEGIEVVSVDPFCAVNFSSVLSVLAFFSLVFFSSLWARPPVPENLWFGEGPTGPAALSLAAPVNFSACLREVLISFCSPDKSMTLIRVV